MAFHNINYFFNFFLKKIKIKINALSQKAQKKIIPQI